MTRLNLSEEPIAHDTYKGVEIFVDRKDLNGTSWLRGCFFHPEGEMAIVAVAAAFDESQNMVEAMMTYLMDYMDGIWRRLHTSLMISWETKGGNGFFKNS